MSEGDQPDGAARVGLVVVVPDEIGQPTPYRDDPDDRCAPPFEKLAHPGMRRETPVQQGQAAAQPLHLNGRAMAHEPMHLRGDIGGETRVLP